MINFFLYLIILFFMLLSQLLTWLALLLEPARWARWLSRRTFRDLYMPMVRVRRRRIGEPEWKRIDLDFGILPPRDHEWWDSDEGQLLRGPEDRR